MKKNLALILAAGSGTRFGKEEPKQFARLAGRTVIEHTLECFENHPKIHSVYVLSHPEYLNKTKHIVGLKQFNKVIKILPGGKTRQESSRIGLEAIDENYNNVLIHDAVRPLLDKKIIDRILNKMADCSAVTPALPSADTIVQVDEQDRIKNIPKRAFLRLVQTPQAFKLDLILKAHRLAKEKRIVDAPDDCSLVVRLGLSDVFVIKGSYKNIKITLPSDIAIAEEIIRYRRKDRR